MTRSIRENPEFFQQIGKLPGRQLESVLRKTYRLVGQVPAGPTMEAIEDTEEFDVADLFSPGEHYLIRVCGESMINDGVRNGDMVVALVDGQEATLKRFYQHGKRIRLQPANERMEPIFVEPKRVEIRGKVVGIIRTQL